MTRVSHLACILGFAVRASIRFGTGSGMEGNRDESEKCMRIGKEAMEAGNLARARKFFAKSHRLYPLPEVEELLSKLGEDQLNGKTAADDRSKVGSADSVKVKSGLKNGLHSSATAEQIEIVRRINKTVDYYEIMGLSKGCTEDEIRKAYRKLSLKVHPDKNKAAAAEEAFKRVSKAFQCLSNAELREKYDHYGPEEAANDTGQAGMRRRRYDPFNDDVDANDIFNSFFYGMNNNSSGGVYQRTQYSRSAAGTGGGVHVHEIRPAKFLGLIQVIAFLALFGLSYLPQSQPIYSLQPKDSYKYEYRSRENGVSYYVRSATFSSEYPPGSRGLREIEGRVEREYRDILIHNCQMELSLRRWGQATDTPNCHKLQQFQQQQQQQQQQQRVY